MKIAFLIEELEESEKFKDFKKKYGESYFTAGFFVLDNEAGEKIQIDYFIPSLNKIAVIDYPFEKSEFKIQEDDVTNPKQLDLNLKVDYCDLRDKIGELCKEREIKVNLMKIIAILQNNVWNLTGLSTTMDVLRIKIDSVTGCLISFEKSGFMDFIKIKKK